MLKSILAFCFIFLLSLVCLGQQSTDNQGKVIFKANTEFPVQLETTVSTEKNKVGDDVNFVLTEDVLGDGDKIPKGSTLYGRVVSIEKVTTNDNTAKVCIMFDFVKKGDDFMSIVAAIISIEPNTEAIKFNASKMFAGGTILSLKGKEIQLDKGLTFRIKLINDVTK